MYATYNHRRRRERGVHAHGGVARKRASLPSPRVLLCFIAAFVLLANARHALSPKVSFLASFWRVTLPSGAYTHKSEAVKYELHTLPEAAAEQSKARAAKNYQKADAFQKIIVDAGYRQVQNLRGEQVLAKKYRIRLRGIDAPENSMPYGKEAKEELMKLVQGRTLKIFVYDTDRYGRLVADVECNGVFVQEHMLKKGFAWHYTAYDRRSELAEWENQARSSRLGLWAQPNPEKPWEWRKKKRTRKW